MRDSDNLHAICLDTYPPCVYMNDVSHAAVSIVHKINEVCGGIVSNNEGGLMVCYTFDAGPNACLFLRKEHVPLVASIIQQFFPPPTGTTTNLSESTGKGGIGNETSYFRGEELKPIALDATLLKKFDGAIPVAPGSLKYIIHTTIGNGPDTLTEDGTALLDQETGYPSFLRQ